MITESSDKLDPFLKWAGGKRWLTYDHHQLFPTEYNRYIEPFLGSGAVFFYLKPKHALLSDQNKSLIETYQAIKSDWRKVVLELAKHHKKHNPDYYYKLRSMNPRTPHTCAAQFIYLNRTCWNGLYRVNLAGQFNVPIGTKKNVILDSDNFEQVAQLLQSAELLHSDFEIIIDSASHNDLLFIDPPYTVKHNLNGFIKYNERLFSWDDQIRLRDAVLRAKERGAKIVLTNANHRSVRSLYRENFEIFTIKRSSVLAGKSLFRGPVSELIVLG